MKDMYSKIGGVDVWGAGLYPVHTNYFISMWFGCC